VPTRDNLHDFFNGLVWQTFPLIKRELNALQAAQIAAAGRQQIARVRRATPPPSSTRTRRCWWCALRAQAARWSTSCARTAGTRRCSRSAPCSARMRRVWLFGHALMEKLVAPRKAITAHTRIVFAPDAYFVFDTAAQRAWIDSTVAQATARRRAEHLQLHAAAGARRAGLVAGQDLDFYLDATVFRPKRRLERSIAMTDQFAGAFSAPARSRVRSPTALQDVPDAVLAGVASRSLDKAEAFAAEFTPPPPTAPTRNWRLQATSTWSMSPRRIRSTPPMRCWR
jgi:hypothetical protein